MSVLNGLKTPSFRLFTDQQLHQTSIFITFITSHLAHFFTSPASTKYFYRNIIYSFFVLQKPTSIFFRNRNHKTCVYNAASAVFLDGAD